MTKEDLEKTYKNLSNSELMDIIQDKFGYTEMAVLVAMSEIAKRNIKEEDIKQYKAEKKLEIRDYVMKNIADDLTFFQKSFFFYIWIPLLNFPLKRIFIEGGYELKLRQASYYSWAGFIFLVIITGFGSNYKISTLTTLVIWMLTFIIAFLFDEFFNRQSQISKLKRNFRIEKKEDSNSDSPES